MTKTSIISKIFPQKEKKSYHSRQIEAVGYLASGFVHEFNNMFSAVLGAAEILRQNASPEQKEYVEIIIKTITRASNLTNQLFGSAHKKKIEMNSLDMHGIIHSVVEILKKNRTPNIQFYEDFGAQRWNIEGDEPQIKNALITLGASAVEAVGQTQGSVNFRTTVTEFKTKTDIGIFEIEAGSYFTVLIEDTGSDFSPEKMEKIFDPYFIDSEENENLGVRLASVLATVGHHHGAILAQSSQHHGSIFAMYLPFSYKSNMTAQFDAQESARKNTADFHIMVVDDDPFVRKVITAMLEKMGYSIILAECGADAIDIYRARNDEISLVILDMVMPNMDGVSCFYELKKVKSNVKVLVSSGYIDNSSIEDMKEDGLCGFITKPYSYSELEKNVANALQIIQKA